MFTLAELQAVASVVRENPHVMVISDEVYKYTVYNALSSPGDPAGAPVGHHHFARLPGEDVLPDPLYRLHHLLHNCCVFAMQTRHVGSHTDHIQRGQDLLGDGVADRLDGGAPAVHRAGAGAAAVRAVLRAHAPPAGAVDSTATGGCAVRGTHQVALLHIAAAERLDINAFLLCQLLRVAAVTVQAQTRHSGEGAA